VQEELSEDQSKDQINDGDDTLSSLPPPQVPSHLASPEHKQQRHDYSMIILAAQPIHALLMNLMPFQLSHREDTIE
jgi:hypothetical protein